MKVKKNYYKLSNRTLLINSSGEDIIYLKEALNKVSFFTNNENDIYDMDMVNTVTRFQLYYGLQPDGIFGRKSREKLEKLINK